MQQSVLTKIKLFLIRNRNSRIFRKFVHVLCCLVVFVTTYALILPAITMEQDTFCGVEEHIHTESCTRTGQENILTCTPESLGIHTHTPECYSEDEMLLCSQADYVIHSHDAFCFLDDGTLVCKLPEHRIHEHTDACYILGEPDPENLHIHSEACYILERGDLTCTQVEREGHTHTSSCYTPGETLECTLAENHIHTESCYVLPLICSASTDPHVHQETCFERGALRCSTPEAHTHTDGCREITLTRTCPEGALHTESCYTAKTHCQIPENHLHGNSCYETVTVCSVTEGAVHVHEAACYGTEPQLQCRLAETHIHVSSCYNQVLGCTLAEDPGHTHQDNCYQQISTANCGLEEGDPEPAEPVLVCTEPEATAHCHTESCFETVEVAKLYICDPEEESHVHSASCCGCGTEEHRHSLICFSDPEADVETPDIWEATLSQAVLTGDRYADILAIAETQLGYTESTRNYTVGEDNRIFGYTRYGDWYGEPYSNWSGMFTAFCLRYAGVEDMPIHNDVRSWLEDLGRLGLFHSADEVLPKPGCLIFFDSDEDKLADRAGIVADFRQAQEHSGASVKTVEGDSSDTVRYQYYDPESPEILGYAFLPGDDEWIPVQKDMLPEEETSSENTDILLGPVVTITAEKNPLFSDETPDLAEPMVPVMRFAAARNGGTSLSAYLNNNGGNYFFVLTYLDGYTQLPKDENGNYVITSNEKYNLTFTMSSPNGFHSGDYYYQLPQGLTIVGGTGDLTVNNTLLGTWEITNDGRIHLHFNDESDSHTKVTLSASMIVSFAESDDPVEFDGSITVVIIPPDQEKQGTKVTKWGEKGSGDNGDKIYWTVMIEGNQDSDIPGNTVTDTITSGQHSFTEDDMQNGLEIGISELDPDTGKEISYHSWIVRPGDPGLTWTGAGWSYRIPESAACKDCNAVLTPGNDNWTYFVKYSTTPNLSDNKTADVLSNRVAVDNEAYEGSVAFSNSDTSAVVYKSGHFAGNANGGAFQWEVRLLIPGTPADEKPTWNWFLQDNLNVLNGNNIAGNPKNDIINPTITMYYPDGNSVNVPHLTAATENNPVAWYRNHSEGENIHQITFLCRCTCTQDHCHMWYESGCGWNEYWFDNVKYDDYCPCWTIEEDVQIVISYKTSMTDLEEAYTGGDHKLKNTAMLFYKELHSDGTLEVINPSSTAIELPIPSMLKKELTKEFNNYVANYTITVNESKVDLTDGSPLTVHDVMTKTLIYVPGSMVITAEDKSGISTTLTYGTDYTLSYNGSGTQTDDYGNPVQVHILDIVILKPQPVKYILNYDTTLDIPEHVTNAIEYSNYATVDLWGKGFTSSNVNATFTDLNFSARQYEVMVTKIDSDNNQPLKGAQFGLFNEYAGLMDSNFTDETGTILFKTSVSSGIILQEHVPYYIQEIAAPEGYILDDTKYWFFFCDSGDDCHKGESLDEQYPGITFHRIAGNLEIPYNFTVKNTVLRYELPNTGGSGTQPYIAVGSLLILSAMMFLVYNHKKCRKEDILSS